MRTSEPNRMSSNVSCYFTYARSVTSKRECSWSRRLIVHGLRRLSFRVKLRYSEIFSCRLYSHELAGCVRSDVWSCVLHEHGAHVMPVNDAFVMHPFNANVTDGHCRIMTPVLCMRMTTEYACAWRQYSACAWTPLWRILWTPKFYLLACGTVCVRVVQFVRVWYSLCAWGKMSEIDYFFIQIIAISQNFIKCFFDLLVLVAVVVVVGQSPILDSLSRTERHWTLSSRTESDIGLSLSPAFCWKWTRWVHFQQNAGLRLFLHTWIVHGIDDCYQFTRTFGGFSAQCLSKLFLKEFTVLLSTTSFGRAFQVVVILIA